MAIQSSVLILLHSGLVLVTTAEDYKCLPLVLRQACCWINETYAARNVIVFVSILINFLGAMINIVRCSFPPAFYFENCGGLPAPESLRSCGPGEEVLMSRRGPCPCPPRTVTGS